MIPDDSILEVMNELADLMSKRKRIEVIKNLITRNPRFKNHPNRDAWLGILKRADDHHRTSIELAIRKLELGTCTRQNLN